MLSTQAALPFPTRYPRRVLYRATKAYIRGKYGEDGWVPCSGESPLSRWFSAGLFLS